MRTKLQPWVDLLTEAPLDYNFAVSPLTICQGYRESRFGLNGLGLAMDRKLGLQKIESMRKMMLIQEEIFRQQVQELHRLYNLQKKLMQELERSGFIKQHKAKAAQEDTIVNPVFSTSWHQKRVATETGHNNHCTFMGRDGRCKLGFQMLAQSTSNIIHPPRRQDNFKTTHEENDVEVELTLGIGHYSRKGGLNDDPCNKSSQVRETGPCSRSNNGDEYGNGGLSMNISSSRKSEIDTRPHWLIRDLSSNRT